ncbi:uncharacterized protein GBIM_19942, partial [Gryllus bimaculatus]
VLAVVRGRAEWFDASDGDAPAHALPACPSPRGETAFVGRARVGGALVPGRVLKSEGGCSISFRGKEKLFREYEVLSIILFLPYIDAPEGMPTAVLNRDRSP